MARLACGTELKELAKTQVDRENLEKEQQLEREHDRSGIRLIDRRIARPDDTAEEGGPADPIRLAT